MGKIFLPEGSLLKNSIKSPSFEILLKSRNSEEEHCPHNPGAGLIIRAKIGCIQVVQIFSQVVGGTTEKNSR
jgi:hypothetical protein